MYGTVPVHTEVLAQLIIPAFPLRSAFALLTDDQVTLWIICVESEIGKVPHSELVRDGSKWAPKPDRSSLVKSRGAGLGPEQNCLEQERRDSPSNLFLWWPLRQPLASSYIGYINVYRISAKAWEALERREGFRTYRTSRDVPTGTYHLPTLLRPELQSPGSGPVPALHRAQP